MSHEGVSSEPCQSEKKSASRRKRKLPPRLYATDRYPDGRVNVYSRPDILTFARNALRNTSQWDKLINSQFGTLFTLPIGRCPHYGKLLHALVCRQLVTQKKYEMWTVFGGHPLRFSLLEFGSVSGLSCAEFPEGYDPDYQLVPTDGSTYYWHTLIGDDFRATIGDLSKKLADEPNMDPDMKLKLVLLMIVDGILIATHQTHKPTLKYVEMLEDVDEFLSFPWGRESFLRTIATLKAPSASSDKDEGVISFAQTLQQQTFRAQGFPLALQLLALQNISGLLPKTLAASESRTFITWPFLGIPKHSLCLADIHAVERSVSLTVEPMMYLDLLPEEGWGAWDDEDTDKKVDNMVKLISRGHTFQNPEWLGGDDSLDLIDAVEKNPQHLHQKHVLVRKRKTTKKGQASCSSSHRPSKRSKINAPSDNDSLKEFMRRQIEDMKQFVIAQLKQHSLEVNNLKQKLKCMKFKRSGKFGSNSCYIASKMRKRKMKNTPSEKSDVAISPTDNFANPMFDSPRHPPEQNLTSHILSGSHHHDWSKYLSNTPNESPDSKGHPVKEGESVEHQDQGVLGGQAAEQEDIGQPTVEVVLPEVQLGAPGINNVNSMFDSPSLPPAQNMTSDILSGSPHHDWNKYLSNMPTESPDSKGHQHDVDDQVKNVKEGVSGEHQDQGVLGGQAAQLEDIGQPTVEVVLHDSQLGAAGINNVSSTISDLPKPVGVDPGVALSPVTEQKNEGTTTTLPIISEGRNRSSPVGPSLGVGQEGVSTSRELAIGKEPLFNTMGQPISASTTKNYSFEDIFLYDQLTDNCDSPIYDTATKKLSFQDDPVYDTATKKLPVEVGTSDDQANYTLEKDGISQGEDQFPVDGKGRTQTIEDVLPTNNTIEGTVCQDPPTLEKGLNSNVQHNYTVLEDGIPQEEDQFPVDGKGSTHTVEGVPPTNNTLEGIVCQDAPTTTNVLQEVDDLVELSDSSPPRKRETQSISEAEQKLVAHFLSKPKMRSFDMLPRLDPTEFSLFQDTLTYADNTEYITRCQHPIDNMFFLQLAKPGNWVSTLHMEVLVSLLSRRLQSTLRTQRAAFATPWLANHLQGRHRSFKAAKTRKPLHWPQQLIRLCNEPGSTWYDDIDTVYLPMCWEGRHWVGIAINLGVWSVEILDPNNDLYDLKEVAGFVAPLVELLPHFIKDNFILPLSQSHGLNSFVWKRVEGIYKNVRGGDCGPVAMKFLEIEASESRHDKMAEITDEIVDDFRGQYAMDVYEEFVAPIYDS